MPSESKPGWIPKAALSTYDGKDFVFSPGSTNGSGVSGEVRTLPPLIGIDLDLLNARLDNM